MSGWQLLEKHEYMLSGVDILLSLNRIWT